MVNQAVRAVAPLAGRRVTKLVTGHPTSDGADVRLTRVIGGSDLPELDPFLLLDEFGSEDPDAYIGGFPDHPHRGFETVTYMLAGRMRHGDNKGNTGLLGPGSVQWMTAGRGIVHSEMPEQDKGLMRGFQLWINLPARLKLAAPRYQDIAPEAIPVVDAGGGVAVKVIAGDFRGVKGPVDAEATAPVYLDIALPPHRTLDVELPAGHAAFAYPYEGMVGIGPEGNAQPVAAHQLAVLSDGARVTFAASDQPVRALLVAGRKLEEPVARYGPFVMNNQGEIRQAIDDYRAGRF
jgi:redox-sensitive bicupin YhaK (pirin superfamily)